MHFKLSNMIYYAVGHIANTHGVKGEVKVLPETDFDRFTVGQTFKIDAGTLTIKTVRPQNKYLLISFEGYHSLDDVLRLKGQTLYTNQAPEILDDDAYHLPTLIGLSVYTNSSLYVGKVIAVTEVPQGHLLRIETVEGKKVYVPFVNAFIKEVTDESITIEPIEGLL